MTTNEVRKASLGKWESIAVEVRPSNSKNTDGTLKPFYLRRDFSLFPEDKFELTVTNYADPFGKMPMAKMNITGHVEWQGEHSIVAGAQKADFTADEEYTVTPLLQAFADILNQYAKGFKEWKVGETQSIFKKAFAPFGLAEGQVFKEYDLIYVLNNMMFWGARHIDGRGFDKEENRPANLQIPMVKR